MRETWSVYGCVPDSYSIDRGDRACPACPCPLGWLSDPEPVFCECRCHDGARMAYRAFSLGVASARKGDDRQSENSTETPARPTTDESSPGPSNPGATPSQGDLFG